MHWIDFSFGGFKTYQNLCTKSDVRATTSTINLLESTMLLLFQSSMLTFIMTFSRVHLLKNHVAAILATHFYRTYFPVCFWPLSQKPSWKISMVRKKSRKKTNNRANHQSGDLLAAIRNHSSFSQVCICNDSDTWITDKTLSVSWTPPFQFLPAPDVRLIRLHFIWIISLNWRFKSSWFTETIAINYISCLRCCYHTFAIGENFNQFFNVCISFILICQMIHWYKRGRAGDFYLFLIMVDTIELKSNFCRLLWEQ